MASEARLGEEYNEKHSSLLTDDKTFLAESVGFRASQVYIPPLKVAYANADDELVLCVWKECLEINSLLLA